MQNPIVDVLLDCEPVRLLLVRHEVLGHRDGSLALDGADLVYRHDAREKRILAKVLEIAAPLRNPRKVHAGRFNYLQHQVPRLNAEYLPELGCEVGVE